MYARDRLKRSRELRRLFFGMFLAIIVVFTTNAQVYPSGECSGPVDIKKPVFVGTKVVAYRNGTEGCPVFVYADGQLVGQISAVPPVGQGEVYLSRALKEGETITAKQDPGGDSTWPQKAATVEKIPASLLISGEKFKTPEIIPPIAECQKGVRVVGLVEGARANVYGGLVFYPAVPSSGKIWTPYDSTFVPLKAALRAGENLQSYQDMDVNFPMASDYSSPKPVQNLPAALPSPFIVEDVGNDGIPDVLVGTNTLTLCDLWVGAVVNIYSIDSKNNWHRVGGGIATNECNWGYVEPLKEGLKYCAVQSLCRLESPKQDQCVSAVDTINTPTIREPLCDGDIDVIVDDTAFGSKVWIQDSNNKNKGNASAPGSTTMVEVSGGIPLKEGERIRVRQSNVSLNSGWSKWVVVESSAGPNCENRTGNPPSSPPPKTQPMCKPGKGTLKLLKDMSPCQTGLIHAYPGGVIPPIHDGVLMRLTNKMTNFRIKLAKSYNQGGSSNCSLYGALCYNVTTYIATIEPQSSWNNINISLDNGYTLYVCLEPVGSEEFPTTIEIDYEYTCKP